MVNCCVPFCTTSHKNAKIRGANFHEFPSDSGLRQKWIRNIHRKDHVVSDRSHVCSLHFIRSDYVEGLKIRRLKKDAIPTEFPGYPERLQARARNSKMLQVAKSNRPPTEKEVPLENDDTEVQNVSSRLISCSDVADDVPAPTQEHKNQSLRLSASGDHLYHTNIVEGSSTENQLRHRDGENVSSEHQFVYLYGEEISTNVLQVKENPNCAIEIQESEDQLLKIIYGQEESTITTKEHQQVKNNVVLEKEMGNDVGLRSIFENQTAINAQAPIGNSIRTDHETEPETDLCSQVKSGGKHLGRTPMTASMLRHSVRLYQQKTYKLKKQLEAATSRITELRLQLEKTTSSSTIFTADIVNDAQNGSTHALFLLDQLQAYGRNRARWSEETLRQCLLWQLKSSKGYRHVRSRNLLKLPSRSTLKRFASASVPPTDILEVDLKNATKENH